MFTATEWSIVFTSALVRGIVIIVVTGAIVQESSAQGILVSAVLKLTCFAMSTLFYILMLPTDISKKCAYEHGTPPQNQNKIVNLERY